MKKYGLVDHSIEYKPLMTKSLAYNETRKRNFGLKWCRDNRCSHVLSMDCDEFYDQKDFTNAKETIEQQGYDGSACMLETYFGSPTWKIEPPEKYFVPFIHRVYAHTSHLRDHTSYPVYCDPTRQIVGDHKFLIFNRHEVVMHHMSYVRHDIRRKLENSTARTNFHDIEKFVEFFTSWKPGQRIFFPQDMSKSYQVCSVSNIFNITGFDRI